MSSLRLLVPVRAWRVGPHSAERHGTGVLPAVRQYVTCQFDRLYFWAMLASLPGEEGYPGCQEGVHAAGEVAPGGLLTPWSTAKADGGSR